MIETPAGNCRATDISKYFRNTTSLADGFFRVKYISAAVKLGDVNLTGSLTMIGLPHASHRCLETQIGTHDSHINDDDDSES